MESKQKNALIVALLAIVLVMGVGYAAFSQALNITGTAQITSTWNVHFDTSKVTATPGVVSTNTGAGGTVAPSGTVSYSGNNAATVAATLNQPGDSVTFTLTIMNEGNIAAALGNPVVTMDGDEDGTGNLTAKKGNIQFTVTPADPATINGSETATMTVKAEFIGSATSVGSTSTADVTITLTATQA